MKSAIEKILDGELNYDYIEPTEEFKRLLREQEKIARRFRNTLSNKQETLYDSLIDIESDMSAEMETVFFKEGFKLGMTLAIESILD